ncbi:energy transducer TonB [Seonamhaeicola marinus]|nr:energy transducer TonB [Seonamhaeicola marinus]
MIPPDDGYVIEIPNIPQAKPEIDEPVKQEKVTKPKDFEIIDNDKDVIETVIDTPDTPVENLNPEIDLEGLPDEPIDEPIVDFILIEEVPVYPGCEKKKGRAAQSKCMSDKINKLIQRKFDVGLADRLGLSGKQRIQVQFKISETGEVSVMRTRAPHPMLEKEAERVVGLIPSMKPGKQRDKAVSVKFNLPINFMVQD